jgi:hypothetical protein
MYVYCGSGKPHVNGLPWHQNFFVQSAVLLGPIAVIIGMFW